MGVELISAAMLSRDGIGGGVGWLSVEGLSGKPPSHSPLSGGKELDCSFGWLSQGICCGSGWVKPPVDLPCKSPSDLSGGLAFWVVGSFFGLLVEVLSVKPPSHPSLSGGKELDCSFGCLSQGCGWDSGWVTPPLVPPCQGGKSVCFSWLGVLSGVCGLVGSSSGCVELPAGVGAGMGGLLMGSWLVFGSGTDGIFLRSFF